MKSIILFALLILCSFYSFTQQEVFVYKGTIGSAPVEVKFTITAKEDKCTIVYSGSYFVKRYNSDMILSGELNICNEEEFMDENTPVSLTEFNGETQTATLTLSGIGEVLCSGQWIKIDGKKKMPVKLKRIK
jgi:hypothetical protein